MGHASRLNKTPRTGKSRKPESNHDRAWRTLPLGTILAQMTGTALGPYKPDPIKKKVV